MRRIQAAFSALCLVVCAATGLAQERAPVRSGTESGVRLTAPAPEEMFTFVVFGDRTDGPRSGIKVLEDAVEMTRWLDADFVMMVGDMVQGYDDAESWLEEKEEFVGVMNRLERPWYPVAGNHDVYERPHTPEGHVELYKEHFGPLYYSFDHKWAHVSVLFSDESMSFSNPSEDQNMSREQLEWLRQDLASTDAERLYVFLHHPRWTPNYAGSNWDEVEAVLQADGRPVTVFAGHIHYLRDDGQKGNIQYYTMGVTGGHGSTHQEAGAFQNIAQITVRRDGDSMAILPVKSVRSPADFPGQLWDEMARFRRSDWATLDGELVIGTEPGRRSELTLTLRGDEHADVAYAAAIDATEGWTLSQRVFQGVLKAGQTVRVPISATAPALSATRPGVALTVRARYPLAAGQEQAMSRRLEPRVRVEGLAANGAASPTENGVLRLNGRSAVRADLPQRYEQLTLEFWATGRTPTGRSGAVTKTENSAFGVFWSDGSGGQGTLPTAYLHTRKGYLSLPALEPWQWDQWTHLALTFDGEVARFFVNGRLQSEARAEAPMTRNDLPMYIGADVDRSGAPTSYFTGQIDEVRVSDVARYSADFAPARAFERDDRTLLLMHFDEKVRGVYPDDSGRGNHGWGVGGPVIEREQR
jgi:hypothetical protein